MGTRGEGCAITDNYERCSCGARYKSKCAEESTSGSGKMCVRDYKSEQTVLDADTAFEMIENPKEPNEKLIELLRLE